MPSDKRKQRQQRVRHEPGDYVLAPNEDSINSEMNEEEANIVSEKKPVNVETHVDEKEKTETSRHYESRAANSYGNEDSNYRRKDERGDNKSNERSYDNRSNEKSYDNRSNERSYDNRSNEKSYDNRSNERSNDSRPSVSQYDNRSNDGRYDNRSNDGRYDNRSSDGRYNNRSNDGRYDNRSNDGRYDNRSNDGRYDNRSNDGRYDNRSNERRYDNRSNDGRYDNRSNDGRYDNRSNDGRYDNRFNDGRYDNRSNDGRYDNRSNERRYDNRSNERGRGRGRGGSRGRGRGRAEPEYQPRSYENRPSSGTNVAVAEQREYEPVMIMESKTDVPKETKETKELAEPAKYRRREVISNWLRYDEIPSEEEPVEGEDYLLGEDFSQVLNLNGNKSSDGFLHLKGEMSWGNVDQSQFGSHGLGALKVADLVAALDTISLHEQLRIPEEALPAFTVSTFKASAEKNRRSYKPDQEYVTDLEVNQKILESLKLSENEPLRLSTEEPNYVDRHDTVDATLKFSSAFQPEPDDVDLDTLLRENSPEHSPQVRVTVDEVVRGSETETAQKKVVAIEKKKKEVSKSVKMVDANSELPSTPNKGDQPPQPERKKELNFTIPKLSKNQNETKTGFDFGLTKVTNDTISKAPTQTTTTTTSSSGKKSIAKASRKKKTKETKEPQDEEQQQQQPKIDLDQPIKVKKAAPVLVSKTEVENLEDWLDSVLDD